MKNAILLCLGIVGCLGIALGFLLVFRGPVSAELETIHWTVCVTFIGSGLVVLFGSATGLKPSTKA